MLSIYAGLRPLVKAGDGKDTAALSRDHTIIVSESGLITITGGKWTTYRKMAEDVIDHAETVAGIDDRRCRTVDLQIHGWTHATIKEPNLAPYGSDAQRISRLIQTDPDLAEKLHPALPCQRGEVIWHIREEMARTVEDVLARRTRALLLNAKASIEAAPVVAALLAKELGRDQAWQDKQVADYTPSPAVTSSPIQAATATHNPDACAGYAVISNNNSQKDVGHREGGVALSWCSLEPGPGFVPDGTHPRTARFRFGASTAQFVCSPTRYALGVMLVCLRKTWMKYAGLVNPHIHAISAIL